MMTIGLTTWTEHPSLLGGTDKLTLTEYSGVLPVVEVDTPFYGIPKVTTVAKWQKAVPDKFQFILKANQVMTLHDTYDEGVSMEALKTAYREYRAMLKPLTRHKQLKAVLFQFPPFSNARRATSIIYNGWSNGCLAFRLPLNFVIKVGMK